MNSGAVFWGASYDWNVREVADVVIRADDRGVHVRLIFDRGAPADSAIYLGRVRFFYRMRFER